MTHLQNCWEITNCGRQPGGPNVSALGECVAAREGMGHSCWAIAGTMCGGIVRGTAAQKRATCMGCCVYKQYNRLSGTHAASVRSAFPVEEAKYTELLHALRLAAAG
jgi:hypothetical protein